MDQKDDQKVYQKQYAESFSEFQIASVFDLRMCLLA